MTDTPADSQPVDPDHELVGRLLRLHPPATPEVAELMDAIRGNFIDLGHTVVALVPRTPDRTVALRKIHEACMATIAAIACNQGDAP